MPKRIQIGNRWIGDGESAFVIAEAGINHQGQKEIAIKLIDVASFVGADAVKFQKRNIKRLLTKEGREQSYTGPQSFGETYEEHREALELSENDFAELKNYAESKNLIFLASPWDDISADFLEEIDILAFKMASGDLTNKFMLEHVAKKKRPMIISTGMSNMSDVEAAYELVTRYTDQIAIMQCTSTYPSEFEDIHLNVIKSFKERFDCPIGYSGHERGIAVSAAAVAIGASIVERHFTLDRTMKGSDHAASLEPVGLQTMIRDIRAIEKAMGSYEKKILDSEKNVAMKLKKSLASAKPIMEGTKITAEHLIAKCPGTGIPLSDINRVIGKTANRNIDADRILLWEYFD